jgi:hypothetical protein
MNETLQRVTDLVRGEIKKLAMGEPVGLTVAHGFVPIQTPQGMQLTIGWIITADMRNPLLGQDQIAFTGIIPCQPGYMPTDRAFKDTAKMALDGVRNLYAEVLSNMNSTPGNPPAGAIDGSGLIMGK